MRPVASTLALQLENLDSGQAVLMPKMAETTGAVIRFPWAPYDAIGSHGAIDQLKPSRRLCEFAKEKAFLVRLTKLQHLLRERIPAPLYRLHDDLEETLLQADLRTEKQAGILWHQLMGKIARMGKPTVSPLIVESTKLTSCVTGSTSMQYAGSACLGSESPLTQEDRLEHQAMSSIEC